MATKLDRARRAISSYFDDIRGKILSPRDIQNIFRQNRDTWNLAQFTTHGEFVDTLTTKLELRELRLVSDKYAPIIRYVWGDHYSPYLLALSLRPRSYLSHGTSVFLHGLTGQLPKTIYVNREQSTKPSTSSSISQDRIHLAFSRSQRVSAFMYELGGNRFVMLSGKQTGNLEVAEITGPNEEILSATKLERTLIDIVVRPGYAGGVGQVLVAYQNARDLVSVNVLVATLKKLKYIYPYHQAIGFLMERAGYPANQLEMLRSLGLRFDFYLQHGMKSPQYDSRWKLFFPKVF